VGKLECQTILKETDIAAASLLTGALFDTDRYPVNRRGTAACQEVISAARNGVSTFCLSH
jgi:hypothetical protein